MKYEKELSELTMTPEMWADLNKVLSDRMYAKVVMDYQRRQDALRPVCNTSFGTCRYCGKFFKCGYNGHCPNQKAA